MQKWSLARLWATIRVKTDAPANAAQPTNPWSTRALATRVGGGLVMLLILCPPILGGLALFGINVFTMLISATIIAMVNTAVGTLRLGLASAMVFILLIPICVLSGTVPLVGTCLIALACIGAGTALPPPSVETSDGGPGAGTATTKAFPVPWEGLYLTWWRGWDLNPRPSGYEPDELPDCSTPQSR